MSSIEFKNVSKSFDKNTVIDNINMTIEDGKFTVLVGPSGCGKTTLIRMIAGLGPATSGKVLIDNVDVTDTQPGKRGVSMVFQNYAIYPTMTVRDNIEFGLINNKVPKETRDELIKEICGSVGLTEYLDRMPSTLSGGQRQRIALARAMVKKPKVFLMDEPLSNLDAKLRVLMRVELIELHKRLKTTFVYVTHDQVEAMSMADTIVLMNGGIIQQSATPEDIYHDPNNLFTAQFIGTPPMNILKVGDGKNYFGFRPERTRMSLEKPTAFYVNKGKIATREMLGSETLYKINLPEGPIMVKSLDEGFRVEQEVCISIDKNSVYVFGEDEQRIREKDAGYDSIISFVGGVSHDQ